MICYLNNNTNSTIGKKLLEKKLFEELSCLAEIAVLLDIQTNSSMFLEPEFPHQQLGILTMPPNFKN